MKRLVDVCLVAALLVAPVPAQARYYDPGIGRFLSQDKYPGQSTDVPSLHKYAYAQFNPLRYTDPTGRCVYQSCGELWDQVTGPETTGAPQPGTSVTIVKPAKPREYSVVESDDAPKKVSNAEKLARGISIGPAPATFKHYFDLLREDEERKAQTQLRGTLLVAGMAVATVAPMAAPLLVETAGVSAAVAAYGTAAAGTAGGIAQEYGLTGQVTPGGVAMSAAFSAFAAAQSMERLRELQAARAWRSSPLLPSGDLASGDLNSITVGRSAELGTESTLEALRSGQLYPGRQGVVLTDRTVAFGDLHSLSSQLGVEVSLSREVVGDSSRYVLRSGSYTSVKGTPFAAGNRTIAHTHLPELPGEQMRIDLPSRADIRASDRLYDAYLAADRHAAPPMSRVVWGPSSGQQTFFGPSFR